MRSCLAEWNLSFNDITATSLGEKSMEETWLQEHELADNTWSLKTTTDSYAISLHRRRADFIVPSKCLRCETVGPVQINNNKSNAVTLGSWWLLQRTICPFKSSNSFFCHPYVYTYQCYHSFSCLSIIFDLHVNRNYVLRFISQSLLIGDSFKDMVALYPPLRHFCVNRFLQTNKKNYFSLHGNFCIYYYSPIYISYLMPFNPKNRVTPKNKKIIISRCSS